MVISRVGRIGAAVAMSWLFFCVTNIVATAQPATSTDAAKQPAEAEHEAHHTNPEDSLPAGTKILHEKNYAGGKNPAQTLDFFVPAEAKSHPVPVVIWIHGGGWHSGDKKGKMFLGLVTRGFAVASIDYRLSQEAIWPAQIYDCKAAVRWVRAQANKYNLDSKHIGVWGGSAGGHLVLMLGTTNGLKELEGDEGNQKFSSDVEAVCDWFGPTDFLHIQEQIPKTDEQHKPKIDAMSLVGMLIGGPVATHEEQAKQASPITYLTKECAPTLILHGDSDPIVPLQQSQEYYDAAKAKGANVTLHIVPNGGHGAPGFTGEVVTESFDFFDKYLKNNDKPQPKRHTNRKSGIAQ